MTAERCRHPEISFAKSPRHGKTTLVCASCGLTKERQATDAEAEAWWPDVAQARVALRAARKAELDRRQAEIDAAIEARRKGGDDGTQGP